jgi:AcrR family transcriptional regulator
MVNQRILQKEHTAREVLAAARDEFERVGFEAANLRAIARRAGVSAGTVLHHYGDKRELLHAALFDELDRALSQTVSELGDGPLEQQLSRLARGVFESYQQRPTLSRTLLKESLFAEPPWAQKFTAQAAGVHQVLGGLVEAAKARGELRRDVDAAIFGVAWLSFFYFGLIGWVQGANERPLALVDKLVGQHLSGLRRRSR